MGGYCFNSKEIEKRLKTLREYLKKNAKELSWKEEGETLEQIDMLKKDLKYARKRESRKPVYSPHVLEMKIKYGWK